MDIQSDSVLDRRNIILPAEVMDIEVDSVFRSSILPQEGEMSFSKIGKHSSSSNLCISDSTSEQKVLATSSGNKFDEEEFFGGSVLNVNGGSCLITENEGDRKDSSLMMYLEPQMDDLSHVPDFGDFNAKSISLSSFVKPIEETEDLVKLMYDRKPFYDSRRNIIAQKPLDMTRGTGRMGFEMAHLTLIEKRSKLKIFLRDKAANDKILELNGRKVEDKHKCKCFAEHSNSLFCVRSRYEEGVQVKWADDKSYAFINVVDDKRFELLFAPLIPQSRLKKHSTIIMQLVFQMETQMDILEQTFYIKFLTFPSRDIDNFIKNLVKDKYVDDSYLDEIKDAVASGSKDLCKVELEDKFWEELKLFLPTIGGEIGFE